jgi:hypothetical protein
VLALTVPVCSWEQALAGIGRMLGQDARRRAHLEVGDMAGQTTRWMQHAVYIGLNALAANAGAAGATLPAAETVTQVVQYREANPALARSLSSATIDSTIQVAQQ